MWKVNPKLLCRKHLLGEHVEMHMFVGTIKKRGINSMQGYINKGLVNISHIPARHHIISEEMERRGYNHNSPIVDISNCICNLEFDGYVDEKANLVELAKRCGKCKKIQEEFSSFVHRNTDNLETGIGLVPTSNNRPITGVPTG